MNVADGEDVMAYDFDKIVDRSNTNSMKWNVAEGELPMWVADMDFPVSEEISKSLRDSACNYGSNQQARAAWLFRLYRDSGCMVSGVYRLVEDTP